MPFLSDVQSVPANQSVPNVLDGKFGRVLNTNTKVSVGVTSSAVDLFTTVLIGDSVQIEDQEVPPTNAFPRNPEDILVQGVGIPGDEIIVKVRNATAAAITANTAVYLEPV